MQILLHLYYITRGIFGHFCAFLGKNSAFRLFLYILSQASEHLIYLFLFILFFLGGGGGVGWGWGLVVRRKFIYFQANFEIFHAIGSYSPLVSWIGTIIIILTLFLWYLRF